MDARVAQAIEALLDQMKAKAQNPEFERLSDEMRTLVRENAIPTMKGPRIVWEGDVMHVL